MPNTSSTCSLCPWLTKSLSSHQCPSPLGPACHAKIARNNTVTGILRLRSTLTEIISRLLVSNSSQAPRLGMSLAECILRPVLASSSALKYTPGERISCDTTTRSAPLITNVPFSVICGKSPRKVSLSLISPVLKMRNWTFTRNGAEKVKSYSRHSCSLWRGVPKWKSPKRNSRFLPVKSVIGEISRNSSFNPSVRNQSKLRIWVSMRLGTSMASRS